MSADIIPLFKAQADDILFDEEWVLERIYNPRREEIVRDIGVCVRFANGWIALAERLRRKLIALDAPHTDDNPPAA